MSDDSEYGLTKRELAGLRSSFSQMERENIAKLRAVIKGQDKTITVLEKSAGFKRALRAIDTPKPIRRRLRPCDKPAKAFQLHLSDTHSREIVTLAQTDGRNEHNAEIGRERLRSIIEQAIVVIKEEARTCTPVHLTVWGGGDWMVNADLHYKMERCVDDEPLTEMEHVYSMLSEELGLLFKKVPTLSNSFIGSFSNHGRDTDQIVPGLEAHRSYDTHIYRRLKEDFPSVKFSIAETPWTVEDVCGFRTMYTHGHVKGCSAKRSTEGIMVPNWNFVRQARMDYNFDAWVQGHQHTTCVLRSTKFAHMQNGSLVGENSYAASLNYPSEPPSQNLAVVNLRAGFVEKVITLQAP